MKNYKLLQIKNKIKYDVVYITIVYITSQLDWHPLNYILFTYYRHFKTIKHS